jgi:CTP-dependent riboflavin kinase
MEEYDRINSELQQLQSQIVEKQWIEKRLNEISAELIQQKELVVQLKQQLDKEQNDVKNLEGLSLSGLFYSILGNKDQQLEKERQEALMMQLKYDEARQSLALKEADLQAIQKRMQQIEDAEKRLNATLEIKLSLLLSAPNAVAQKLKMLHEQGQALKKEKQEIGEALEAAKAYLQLLSTLIKQLRSAKDWGTWDVLGGGMLSSYVKQQRLNEVRNTVNSLRHYESNFRRELSEVRPSGALNVEVSSFEGMLDMFFDNLITDWIVQQRINRSLAGAQKAYDEVVRILSALKVKYQEIDDRIETGEAAFRKEIIAVK